MPHTSQNFKLQQKLKSERSHFSYSNPHHQFNKDSKDIRYQSSGDHQKQLFMREVVKEDEVVRFMSNLPSYLERGENFQENVLNVGVLNWGHLEKWQYHQKQMAHRSSCNTQSSSYTSSSSSTDGSFTYSNGGHSSSPAYQKAHRPSLQFHLMASSNGVHSQAVKSTTENPKRFLDTDISQRNILKGQGKFNYTAPDPWMNNSNIKLEELKKIDSDQKSHSRKGSLENCPSYEMESCRKVSTKTQDDELTKTKGKVQKPSFKNSKQDIPIGSNNIVLLLPRELQESNDTGAFHKSSKAMYGQVSAEACQSRFSESSKDACTHRNSDIPYSFPLPSKAGRKHSQVKQSSSPDVARTKLSSTSSHCVTQCSKMGMTPSRGKNLHEKKSTVVPTGLVLDVPFKVSDKKPSEVVVQEGRSTSPFSQFTSVVGKISKSSILNGSLDVINLSSVDVSGKFCSENAVAFTHLDTSRNHNINATGRRNSIPLKPEPENCHHLEDQLKRGSVSTSKAHKSYDGLLGSFNLQSHIVKLDIKGNCKTIDVQESVENKKHGLSTVQALLQITVKSGLPLCTFSVNKERDIFAATVKFGTMRKDDCSCTYTFFNIQNIKKNNGRWIKQHDAGKGRNCINVLAQMKVSNSRLSNTVAENQFNIKEFVLFSVDIRQSDHQTSDLQLKDELSATVVKIPAKNNLCSLKHGPNYYDKSQVDLKDSFPSNLGCISTTLILPSGTHSLSSKGRPSPLIERWRSGGSCDCGGWDLGCKLRIFDNNNQVSNRSSSTKSFPLPDRFELFSRGEVKENRPVLTMVPFKERIYSVEYNSSLSILQAFSTCVAVLDSGGLFGISEASKSFGGKTSCETILV